MELGLATKTALVCGASSGLGFAIARTLAAEGCRVAINSRSEHRLARAVAELKAGGGSLEGFVADVSVADECGQLVERVHRSFGALDILVCNAGGPPSTNFADADADQWQRALDLNLLSTIHLCRAVVPLMRGKRWGRILCLTSVAAKQPIPGLILSSTSRAGILGFAKSLSTEEAPHGITVNVVCPGYMRTERVEELVTAMSERDRRPAEDVNRDLIAGIPMGRMGEPSELADVFAFLASDRASYITGVALQVDGGYIRSIM